MIDGEHPKRERKKKARKKTFNIPTCAYTLSVYIGICLHVSGGEDMCLCMYPGPYYLFLFSGFFLSDNLCLNRCLALHGTLVKTR